jgi:hypothetical protein
MISRWLLTLIVPLSASSFAQPCALSYQFRVQPTQIEVSLNLPSPGPGGATHLSMSTGWAGASGFAPRGLRAEGGELQAADRPGHWDLRHSGPARLHYQVALQGNAPGAAQEQVEMYRPQGAPDHFQSFGYGLLLLPGLDDRRSLDVCMDWQTQEPMAGPVFTSFGLVQAGRSQRIQASAADLRHAVFAGGEGWRLQHLLLPDGGQLNVAVRGSFPNASDRRFAQRAAHIYATQRRFWRQKGEPPPLPQWLLLTPNFQAGGVFGGTLVTRAAVLHVAADFALESPSFVKLIAHENLHAWIPGRFGAPGPGGEAEVPGYWLSEGFTDFFTHRLLLASGSWSLDDYAARLTDRLRLHQVSDRRDWPAARIAAVFFSDRPASEQMYLRGEWLALRWEERLRELGAPSLPTLMRRILLPAIHAESLPPTERLLAVMRTHLGGEADADVRRFITEGEVMAASDISPGPCLILEQEQVRLWALGFDRASFQSGKAQGVDPEGPAYAAGLRDGMSLPYYSVRYGDVSREVQLQVRDGDGPLRDLRYLPLAIKAVSRPVWRVRPGAMDVHACQRWIRLD